jgi:hypothetical protein
MNRPVGAARALLGTKGRVLSARGAQQEQQAARDQGKREGAIGGKGNTAHPETVADFRVRCKRFALVGYHCARTASAGLRRAALHGCRQRRPHCCAHLLHAR